MNVQDNRRYISWLLIALLLLTAVWAVYESRLGGHSHFGLYRDTPNETIVIKPGRAVAAYYSFLVILALLPASWFLRIGAAGRIKAAAAAAVVCAMASAAVAGFGYETMQTEIRLTFLNVRYHSGGRTVAMLWSEIDAMAVRTKSSSQWIDLLGARDAIRIDLGPFTTSDRRLLVTELPRIARLGSSPRKLPDGWVWRRSGIQLPE